MPVWHASLSLQDPAGGPVAAPGRLERAAVALLAGVGDPDREWWIWNPRARVAHLRVPLTAEENTRVPPGIATSDAGDTGPLRRRRRYTGGR